VNSRNGSYSCDGTCRVGRIALLATALVVCGRSTAQLALLARLKGNTARNIKRYLAVRSGGTPVCLPKCVRLPEWFSIPEIARLIEPHEDSFFSGPTIVTVLVHFSVMTRRNRKWDVCTLKCFPLRTTRFPLDTDNASTTPSYQNMQRRFFPKLCGARQPQPTAAAYF